MTPPRSNRLGTVTIEGDHATLVFERRLRHPVRTVWEAITKPEHLARWYLTQASLEERTGGSIEYVSGPSHFHVTGRILVWDPPRVYEHEWNVEPRRELPHGENSVVRWELTPDGEETILRVTHRHLTRGTSRGFVAGLHVFLERLEDELEGKPLGDWVARVNEVRALYQQPGT